MEYENPAEHNLPIPGNAPQPAPYNAMNHFARPLPIDELFTALNNLDSASVLRILDQHDVDLSTEHQGRFSFGQTPIIMAIASRNIEAFKAFMNYEHIGKYINTPNSEGLTPFFVAVEILGPMGKIMLDTLVEKKADIHQPFKPPYQMEGSELSPLTWAVMNKNKYCVKLLLDSGAEVNPLNNYDKISPLAWAVRHTANRDVADHHDIVKMLVDAGAIIDADCMSTPRIHDKLLDILAGGNIGTLDLASKEKSAHTAIYNLVADRTNYFTSGEAWKLEIASEQFDEGNFNLTKIFFESINAIELVEEKKEFLSIRIKMSAEEGNYFAMDALRDLGAEFYQETPKGEGELGQETKKQAVKRNPKKIIKADDKKTVEKSSPEKTAIKNYIESEFLTIKSAEENFKTVYAEDKDVLSTIEDKALFTDLMSENALSFSRMETIIFAKMALDQSAQDFLKNETSITSEGHSTEAAETQTTAASMDLPAISPGVDVCLIAQLPE